MFTPHPTHMHLTDVRTCDTLRPLGNQAQDKIGCGYVLRQALDF